MNRLLKKIDETGTTDRKPGSGKKRTVRTAENVNSVEALILRQEYAPGTQIFVQNIFNIFFLIGASDIERDWNSKNCRTQNHLRLPEIAVLQEEEGAGSNTSCTCQAAA